MLDDTRGKERLWRPLGLVRWRKRKGQTDIQTVRQDKTIRQTEKNAGIQEGKVQIRREANETQKKREV